jgi:molecular chaperone DnaJ
MPAGTQTGSLFRLEGKGMPKLGSQNTGDLYIKIRVSTPRDLSDEQRDLLARFHLLEQERGSR